MNESTFTSVSTVYANLKASDGIVCEVCGRADFLANAERGGWAVERVNGHAVTKCPDCMEVPVA